MSNKKISDLTDGGALQATDEVVVARAGQNYSILGSALADPLPASLAREQINGPGYTTIANNATALLPWARGTGPTPGDILLDFTDATRPTVTQAGVYAVSVAVVGSQLTVGGFFWIQLQLDEYGSFTQFVNESRPSITGSRNPETQSTTVYYIPNGGVISVTCTNVDGAASRGFIIDDAYVQRVA